MGDTWSLKETVVRWTSSTKQTAIAIAGIILTLLLWEVISVSMDFTEIFPPISMIVSRFIQEFDIIWANVPATFVGAGLGFVLAVLLATITAVILVRFERVRETVMPIIIGGNSVPRITIAPLVIFYVSGFQSKFIIVSWIAYFPMLINTMEGLSVKDEDMRNLMDNYHATYLQRLRKVMIPQSLPYIFDGLKVAMTMSIIGAIVVEYIVGNEGLGVIAVLAMRSQEVDLLLAVAGFMGIVSMILLIILFVVQDKVIYWRDANLLIGGEQ